LTIVLDQSDCLFFEAIACFLELIVCTNPTTQKISIAAPGDLRLPMVMAKGHEFELKFLDFQH